MYSKNYTNGKEYEATGEITWISGSGKMISIKGHKNKLSFDKKLTDCYRVSNKVSVKYKHWQHDVDILLDIGLSKPSEIPDEKLERCQNCGTVKLTKEDIEKLTDEERKDLEGVCCDKCKCKIQNLMEIQNNSKMKITNKTGIPESIYRAISGSNERNLDSKIEYTVTELLLPNKILILRKRHRDEIEEDAADNIWRLIGKATHYICEKAQGKHATTEKRMQMMINNKIISGQVDIIENGKISDFKLTSVWTYIHASRVTEWEQQLNYYNILAWMNGHYANKLSIIAIFRDWSKSKARYKKNYPRQIEEINCKIWDLNIVRDAIALKIETIEADMKKEDDEIPCCQPDERWQKEEQWAVMKPQRKSAVKLHATEEAALEHIQFLKDEKKYKDHYIEKRESVANRCMDYCNVSKWCNYYQNYIENNGGAEK